MRTLGGRRSRKGPQIPKEDRMRGRVGLKRAYYWRDGREEGGMDIPIEGGARVGGRGRELDRGKFEFPWEKKGGRKGGRTERRCVWKISARASANAKTERLAGKKKRCDRDGG